MTLPGDLAHRMLAQLEAQTALLRVMVGPALDDAHLASAGVTLPDPLSLPIVIRPTTYLMNTIIRLPRTTSRLTIMNLGGLDCRVRIYGAALPVLGQPVDATSPPPTDEITIRPSLTLDLPDIVSHGFLLTTGAILQVIAR